MKVSATMSVKLPPSRERDALDRVFDFLLADWWIDVLLMLFIVWSMLFFHQ